MIALQICIFIIRYLELNIMVANVSMVVKTIQERSLLSMAMQVIVN